MGPLWTTVSSCGHRVLNKVHSFTHMSRATSGVVSGETSFNFSCGGKSFVAAEKNRVVKPKCH